MIHMSTFENSKHAALLITTVRTIEPKEKIVETSVKLSSLIVNVRNHF